MSKRFFIKETFSENAIIALPEKMSAKEIKHITRVMRLGIGDNFTLINPSGEEALVEIINDNTTAFTVKVLTISPPKLHNTKIEVFPSVLKGPKMDWLIEKTTELGVAEIFPLITEHTVATTQESGGRLDRWKRIAESAVKQSGSGALPNINALKNLEEAIALVSPEAWKFVLHPSPQTPILWTALKNLKESSPLPEKIVLFLGPEGGFSNNEVKLLKEHGFLEINLGESILRGETAAIVATALVQHWIDFQC